jgi:hypothetical protein
VKTSYTKLLSIFLFLTFISCTKNDESNVSRPLPRPIGADEEELTKRRKQWIEISHRSAPGVDWREIEAANVENNIRIRNARRLVAQRTLSTQEVFANGKLSGTWIERGPNDQAGSVVACDYDAVGNNLYVISDGGSIWRNNGLAVSNWTLLNDDYQFRSNLMSIIRKSAGGTRLFAFTSGKLKWSDNEGSSFSDCSVPFPVAWGGNQVLKLYHNKTSGSPIYLLATIWDDASWSARLALYRSTDEGLNFTKFYVFSHSSADNVKLSIPYNTTQLYIFDGQTSPSNILIQTVTGTSISTVNTCPKPEALTGNIQFAATFVSGTMYMYFLNNKLRVFQSTNSGSTWTFKGTLPQSSWDRLDVSNTDGLKVFSGAVEAMRSTTGGASWSIVNLWHEYYGNVASKLHADIMNLVQYKKTDGTPFMIINNHGGVAISYDNLATTNNLTMSGLRSAQYYDILTAPDNANYLYAGSQDQGFQKNTTATTSGMLNFAQPMSGDFGYLTLADNNRTLYTQYPGGDLYIYRHPAGNYIKNWKMTGTTLPNAGWMLPMKNVSNSLSDTVLMAGGNLTGGAGSYLCRVSTQFSSPYTVTATQYNYNFRANSNNTTSGITAIEVSQQQPERMYVATEDGTFFYSTNHGSSWTKSSTFSVGGGWWLYGATILASELTPDLLWYGGSGYGGSSMFKSTNGGQTFTSMANGLPQTLVHEVVANLNETMLFAATDAGPYVYVVADNMWYPLHGANNPIQAYTAVEFIAKSNTVRFSTYGRGIFDLVISEPVVYYFIGNGNWSDPANWVNQQVPPTTLTGNHEVFINPSANGECILNVNQTINAGARFRVARNKKFRTMGNLNLQ